MNVSAADSITFIEASDLKRLTKIGAIIAVLNGMAYPSIEFGLNSVINTEYTSS